MSDYWTFAGVPFRRLVSGADSPTWFPRQQLRTVHIIAASNQRIVDRGGTEWGVLAFRAWFDTQAEADTVIAAFNTQGTLTSPSGQSAQAILVVADLVIPDGVTVRVDLAFEVVT
jgi:UDP-N-acetyl-D-mannosaminuronic acid transferase (WecB/TagA/CpsF family)